MADRRENIADRWTDYGKELYSHPINRDPCVLSSYKSTNHTDFPITHEEVGKP